MQRNGGAGGPELLLFVLREEANTSAVEGLALRKIRELLLLRQKAGCRGPTLAVGPFAASATPLQERHCCVKRAFQDSAIWEGGHSRAGASCRSYHQPGWCLTGRRTTSLAPALPRAQTNGGGMLEALSAASQCCTAVSTFLKPGARCFPCLV